MTLTEAHLRDVLQLRSHLRVCYRYCVSHGSAHGTCGSLKRGFGVACMSSVNLGVKSSTDQESQKLFMYTAPTNAETFVF